MLNAFAGERNELYKETKVLSIHLNFRLSTNLFQTIIRISRFDRNKNSKLAANFLATVKEREKERICFSGKDIYSIFTLYENELMLAKII